MTVKRCVVIGTVAVGWMLWTGGYAQAVEYAQDQRGSGPSERAQVPGAGDNMGSGAPGEGVGIGPSGQTAHGVPRTNGIDTMGEGSGQRDMRMLQQGAERGMQSDPGRGGVPGPGSAGGTLGGGSTNSLGPTSGGGSAGMGMSGGASGGGGR